MDALTITYITIEAVFGVLSVLGNGLVLWAIYINRRLRTVTNMFIASLAVADLMVGIVVAPSVALTFLGLPENFYGCVFLNSLVILLTQGSIFGLLAIAIERFIAIKSPFTYIEHFTHKTAMIIITISWMAAILIGLIPLFGWNLGHKVPFTCSFTSVIDMKFMVYFNFFACILLPLFIMFGFYSYIFKIIRQQMKHMVGQHLMKTVRGHHRTRRFLRDIKAAKSLAIVIILFAVCWLPVHILNTLTLLCPENCSAPYELLLATIILSHANSAVNPFLYAYGNSKFRTTFKNIFGCRKMSPYTSEDYLDSPTNGRQPESKINYPPINLAFSIEQLEPRGNIYHIS